jgi:hypothetical protein
MGVSGRNGLSVREELSAMVESSVMVESPIRGDGLTIKCEFVFIKLLIVFQKG